MLRHLSQGPLQRFASLLGLCLFGGRLPFALRDVPRLAQGFLVQGRLTKDATPGGSDMPAALIGPIAVGLAPPGWSLQFEVDQCAEEIGGEAGEDG
jgi:hypothetical protein